MKLVSFEMKNKRYLGVLTEDETKVVSVSDVLKDMHGSEMIEFIQNSTKDDLEQLTDAAKNPSMYPKYPVSDVRICAPIEKPIHDILCVGVNYKDHLDETKENLGESGFQESSRAVYFSKRARRILGSDDVIKSRLDLDEELDYEVELAVIIGKEGKDIKRKDAEAYIFGYSVFNDLSSRGLQRAHNQWFRGKSLDTYTAMGPVILTKDELPFPIEVDVISTVNGQIRQKSNTRFFLTDIPSIIEELSKGMTLEAGDIIATGTPAGVGMGMEPKGFMKRGDEVICEIPPIGRLKNQVE